MAVGHSGGSGDGGCLGSALSARIVALCLPSLLVSISALPGAESSDRMCLCTLCLTQCVCRWGQALPGTGHPQGNTGQGQTASPHSPGLCLPAPCRQHSTTLLLNASALVGWRAVGTAAVQGLVGWDEDSSVGKAKAVPSAEQRSSSRG